ncbi:hypothetical protein V6N12_062058 [Hibiscus sabdariffa]|uniref:Uncharacterized protein n=1 Tax=Hibiscus sabdariffa TaxID=183260 RepID=A0ABR2AQI3_9ROSI
MSVVDREQAVSIKPIDVGTQLGVALQQLSPTNQLVCTSIDGTLFSNVNLDVHSDLPVVCESANQLVDDESVVAEFPPLQMGNSHAMHMGAG